MGMKIECIDGFFLSKFREKKITHLAILRRTTKVVRSLSSNLYCDTHYVCIMGVLFGSQSDGRLSVL